VPHFLPKIPHGLAPNRTQAGVLLKTKINLHYTRTFRWHLTHNTACIPYKTSTLTLILLTWNIEWAPNNASKWQMGFNSAFKGLMLYTSKNYFLYWNHKTQVNTQR